MMGGLIWTLICTSIFLGIAMIFIRSPVINMLYSVFGVVCASIYVIYDVQLIFEGKHQRARKLSQEDYVRGALMLYLDVIYMFMKILQLLG